MNRSVFFAAVRNRPFGGHMTQQQVDGMNRILDEWERRKLTLLTWLAYMLATVFWETGRTMWPVNEGGLGRGHPYGQPDPVTKKAYYGRGLVQLTWKANYETMGRLLKVDLVNHPELALNDDIAIAILFEGMTKGESGIGDFTHKSLEDYFTPTRSDPVNARRIINGMDHADSIASIYNQFLDALTAAAKAPPEPKPAQKPVTPPPPDIEPTPAKTAKPASKGGFFLSALAALARAFGRKG